MWTFPLGLKETCGLERKKNFSHADGLLLLQLHHPSDVLETLQHS